MRKALMQSLHEAGVSLTDFQSVIHRLLARQVLYRDPERAVEIQLYDLYVRIRGPVREYLGLMGVEVHHDERACYVIAYPPGAQHPHQTGDNEDVSALYSRPGRDEVALLLVCRKLFEDKILAGEIGEEEEAYVSLEEIYTTYEYLIQESMPEQVSRREALFRRMRQLSVINAKATLDVRDPESLVGIRAVVLALSFKGFVDALHAKSDNDAEQSPHKVNAADPAPQTSRDGTSAEEDD